MAKAAKSLLEGLFEIDAQAHRAARPVSDNPVVQAIGWLSEAGDQPQMLTLSGGVLAAGLVRGDRRMTHAGARMIAAHLLATHVKSFIKHRVDRTRPRSAGAGASKPKPGKSHAKEENSFPSGHSAGALAVARAFGREYPEHRGKALAAAGAAALAQIPRAAHYPTDVGAGLLIGWASEVLVDRAVRLVAPPLQGRGWGGAGMATNSTLEALRHSPPQPLP